MDAYPQPRGETQITNSHQQVLYKPYSTHSTETYRATGMRLQRQGKKEQIHLYK